MKKIMLVFGTRPDAVKMCPLALELKKREHFDVKVCLTGQHREMLDSVMATFGVSPDYDLAVMRSGQSLADITSKIIGGMTEVLKKERPDILLVHGDTSSAFSAALAAFYLGIPVGHVEAGLRTYDMSSPFPEEFNRRAVSLISSVDFAPTEEARERLIGEGKRPDRVFVTGNTVVDALKYTVKKNFPLPILLENTSKLILLTTHRRENIGDKMRSIFRAVRRICKDFPFVKVLFPCHPNPEVRLLVSEELVGTDHIKVIEPQEPISFHNLLSRAYLVLTDSGGIQEECSALQIPTLVLRDHTERGEGITAGTLRLVGTDEEIIYENAKVLLENDAEYEKMKNTENPFGDGRASEKIADILEGL